MDDSEISDQAIDWFAYLRSDRVTEDKRILFVEWLRQNESHAIEFIKISQLWDDLAVVKDLDFPELREFPVIRELFARTHQKGVA